MDIEKSHNEFFTAFVKKNQEILQTLAEKKDFSISLLTPYVARFNQLYPRLIEYFSSHPEKLFEAQMAYCQEVCILWQKMFLTGLDNFEKEHVKDHRFQDAAWELNPLFYFIKHSYFLMAKHIRDLLQQVEDLDKKTVAELDFYLRQMIDACAPSNFAFTNPEVLRATEETQGKNILKGLDNFLHDLQHSENFLQIKMTDTSAFSIGKNLATTPGKVIYQNELMQLIQYLPQTEKVFQRPFLMIPPWINKYYILDLTEQKSLVSWLVQQGYTVFMISWVNPDKRYANKNFENYMSEGPLAALDVIEKATGERCVNALGFCIGGTLLACTLAYLTEHHDDRIKSGTYLATLLDFNEPGELGNLLHEAQLEQIKQEMNERGYYDGRKMAAAFNLLRANDLIWSYYVKNYLLGDAPAAFDLLYWNSDATHLPEAMHYFYLQNMYVHNRLAKSGGVVLHDTPIDLGKITVPLFFLATQLDHIAPWQSMYAGIKLHSGPVKFVLGRSGHIAGVVNPPLLNKYGFYTNDKLSKNPATWLKNAKENQGSWWPYWEKWLRRRSGEKVIARVSGETGLPILEDAPGSYVRLQLNKEEKYRVNG